MANVTKPFNNIHFLTEDQYRQETLSENDIYAVQMLSITPGEIILKGFQNGIEIQLTNEQKAAARAWFGIPDSVVIKSSDPTVTEATMVDAELMNVNTSMSGTPSNNAILTEKAVSDAIANKYTMPTSGIPKTDLASAVQTSLGKADSAYQKASTGIPKTDLASAVQTSLGKADNAVPSSKITYETWTFTLADGSTVTKKVVIWTGA